jgi:tetratricopeptide (TPR) repeat protein
MPAWNPRALTLLLFLFWLSPLSAEKAERIELYYGIAQGNYLIGDLRGAASGTEQILKIDPDSVPALTLKARIQLDQGKATAALATAERAIALEPENLEHPLLKALILGNLDRRKEALELIESVIAQSTPASDDHRAANQLMGLIRMAEGNWDAAAESFNRIYLSDPESATTSLKLSSEAYLEKARSALRAGKQQEAITAIDQAIAVYQGKTGQEALLESTNLRMMRARTLAQLGEFDAAISDLQILTGQQPENLEAAITLASLYASAGRWASLEGLIPIIATQPNLQDIALYFEGRASLAKGRVGSARSKFEEAIELRNQGPLQASLHFYRGLCLDRLERKEEAQAEILTALDADFLPETTEEAVLASRTLIRAKQAARAIPILEALSLNKIAPSAEVWALLGRAHHAEGTTTLAISAFNESLAIDPDQAEIRAIRGSLLRTIGDLEGAGTDYEAACLLDPKNPAYLYALGLVHFQQGQLIEAEQRIGLAAQLLPENAAIQLLDALLAYTIGSPKSAQSALDRSLKLSPEKPNETAYYLEYALNSDNGLKKLTQHANQADTSSALKSFHDYCAGQLDRKGVLDTAGRAATPEIAQQQICAAAYWMAQHERQNNRPDTANELLNLALQIGNPDIPEFQFAQWQLKGQ